MGAKREDWDEKTVYNSEPANRFAADQSGARPSQPHPRAPWETYSELEVTRVREVPSAVLRAAADPDRTLETPPEETQERLAAAIAELTPPAAETSADAARWMSMIALGVLTLAMVGAMLLVALR
jgi:hypothetical protein